MTVIKARLVGPRMATWSPGTSPRACKAAPTARASSWICAHETKAGPSAGATDAPTKLMPAGLSAAPCKRSMIDPDVNDIDGADHTRRPTADHGQPSRVDASAQIGREVPRRRA